VLFTVPGCLVSSVGILGGRAGGLVGHIQPLKRPDVLLHVATPNWSTDRDPTLAGRLVVLIAGGPSGSGLDQPEPCRNWRRALAPAGLVRLCRGQRADQVPSAEVLLRRDWRLNERQTVKGQ